MRNVYFLMLFVSIFVGCIAETSTERDFFDVVGKDRPIDSSIAQEMAEFEAYLDSVGGDIDLLFVRADQRALADSLYGIAGIFIEFDSKRRPRYNTYYYQMGGHDTIPIDGKLYVIKADTFEVIIP